MEMEQYRHPVRKNNRQNLFYTFRNYDTGARIDLTPYSTVSMDVKLNGELYETVEASFVDKTGGKVGVVTYKFDEVGRWDIQFVCRDGTALELYGTPLQFDVVMNVEDLDLSQSISE
jgi:hypothetical protein